MSKKKVLIVDDEETNILILKSLFKSENFDVSIAKDGEKGINTAKEILPDLILMDVMMPKINGFKACGLIKADNR